MEDPLALEDPGRGREFSSMVCPWEVGHSPERLHTQESLGSTSGTQEVWMGREVVVVRVGGVGGGE